MNTQLGKSLIGLFTAKLSLLELHVRSDFSVAVWPIWNHIKKCSMIFIQRLLYIIVPYKVASLIKCCTVEIKSNQSGESQKFIKFSLKKYTQWGNIK